MKKYSKAIAAIMLMTMVVFTAGCGKDDNSNNGGGIINNGGNDNGGGGDTNVEVTVITTTPQNITSTSVVCGGGAIAAEGMTLSEVGVCWGTSSTPTVADSHLSAEGVEEQFTCTVSGLEPDTKYYVRAYALCGEKFYYGNIKDFTTLSSGGGGTNGEVTVITTTPQEVTSTSAVCGGVVSVAEGITLSEVGVCWGTESTPTVAGLHHSAGTLDEQFACTLDGLDPETRYYVCAYALCGEEYYYGNVKDFTTLSSGGNGTYNGHDYVDLGLPSRTLWATCNVGATTPTGYGDYFAWGETEPKFVYNWATYFYSYGSSEGNLTKYCPYTGWGFGYNGFTDDLTILEPIDDAATVNWGSGWSMPTNNQWWELCQNTSHTWTTQNGVNGMLFTASNGNNLFLPAAGYRNYEELDYAGTGGLYWANSIQWDNPPFALGLDFDYSGFNVYSGIEDWRCYGHSVRAVRSAK